MRKISALSLAITLAMGVGLASAQTSTSTQKTVTTPLGSVDSTTTTHHEGPTDGKTVEQKKSTTEHPDGSVTTDHSKTVTKSD
jgi:ABC-type glycerol-3-phosphate transport system substrate-binding protein